FLAMAQFLLLLLALLAFLYYVYRQCFRKRTGPGLPPGPRPLPIIGNYMHLPPKGVPEFEHWLKHKDIYGPISSVTVMGHTLIIIHDREVANHLLEKCSNKTSARPKAGCAVKLCGFDKFIPFNQCDQTFRLARKMMYRELGSRASVAHFDAIQEVEVRRSLLRVLNKPEDLMQHFKTQMSAIILKMTYGYSVEAEKPDPLVELIKQMLVNIVAAATPLTWLVDLIPPLEYLPEGFPGTSFRKTARQWYKITRQVVDTPYSFTRKRMKSGSHRPSYVSKVLENDDGGNEDVIRITAATMYVGAVETTTTALSTCILAMIQFPQVQRKAQEEIDRVVGTDRLPRSEDRAKLPYIEALVKELHRWCPVAPMGIPHVVEEDIVYRGYLFPKGSYLLPAVWWFLNDPDRYPDPRSFKPERFLETSDQADDPFKITWGYGRRICPGRFFADSTMFITLAQMLAAFSIGKAVDEKGEEMETRFESTPGLINHLKEYRYSIMPRSAGHAELVRAVEMEHPWEESDAVHLEWDNSDG
ncbi:hypothetical protein CP533_4730, partial [Ophiocordyceps camponoti-saundersi (nom. inval.)]